MDKSLVNVIVKRLTITMFVILLLSIPVFYFLTRWFYAEDLYDVIEEYQMTGRITHDIDLNEDVMVGVMLQFFVITVAISFAMMITLRSQTRKIIHPLNGIISRLDNFKLGKSLIPSFPRTGIKEYDRISEALTQLLHRDEQSYKAQKEFTENASHELQTPIAVVRADLDLLLQENPDERQSAIIDDMYTVTKRLEHLNRSLLLLARIENEQYEDKKEIDLYEAVDRLLPNYHKIYSTDIKVNATDETTVIANSMLIDVLINNLVVNALRYADEATPVVVAMDGKSFSVSNHSSQPELDKDRIFRRFHNPHRSQKGNGLGLAIVKQICDHYHWRIDYSYKDSVHTFTINLEKQH